MAGDDNDPAVKAWSERRIANPRLSRQIAGPGRDRETTHRVVRENIAELFRIVARPGRLFAMKFQPPKQQPMLVTLTSANDLKSEKVLLDPNKIDHQGTTAIDWFVPSLDGRKWPSRFRKAGVKMARCIFTRRDRQRTR